VVNRTGRLNTRQLEVLNWIANGCPDGVMKDFTYKTTAVALQGRRLVIVSRKGGGWQAALTEVGAYYLEHGAYPAETSTSSRPAATCRPEQRSVPAGSLQQVAQRGRAAQPSTVDEQAQALVARVIRAGGVVQLDLEGDETDYKRLITASKRAPNLPFAKQLRMRSVGPYWSDDYEVYFDEDFWPRVPLRPVPVPERVATYHPVVAAYKSDPDRHEVSTDSLGRACRVLQALVTEAERRGHTGRAISRRPLYQDQGAPVSRRKDGQLEIVINDFVYRLRIRERAGPGRESQGYRPHGRRLPRWQEVRHTTFVPTGELRITIEEGYGRDGRPAEFRDGKRESLEERLPALLREPEIRAREDDWRRQEQKRQADLQLRRWEQAIEQAKLDFREAQRAAVLSDQLQQWRLARDLDLYLSEMAAAVTALPGKTERAAAEQWLAWVREYRRAVDPLRQPICMPPDRKPSKEELKPFLDGWSPYGPGG